MTDRRSRAARILPSIRTPSPLPSVVSAGLEAHPSFVRGLSIGLLVGAAVAGSTIWGRWRSSRDVAGATTASSG